MSFIGWIIFGLIVGALAKWISPGRDPGGWLGSIVVGILGAFVGGWIGSQFFGRDVEGFDFISILLAIAGSVLLLTIYKALMGKKRTRN